jgi:hypothetical protein
LVQTFMKDTGAWLKAGADAASAKGTPLERLSGFVATRTGSGETGKSVAQPPPPPIPEHFDTKAMDPMPGEVESFIGVVREMSIKTTKLDALYDGLGSMGQKALGLPARSNAVQLTIEKNDLDPVESYTVVAERKLTLGIHPKHMVWVGLEARHIPDRNTWIVTSIESLG